MREITWFQSERFDSCFRKQPQRFDALVRGHDRSDNCLGLSRVRLGHEVDRANGWAAAERLSCYQDNLTISHALIYCRRCAVSTIVRIDPANRRCGNDQARARKISPRYCVVAAQTPNDEKWEA